MIQVTLRYFTTLQSEKSLRQLKQRHKIVGPFHDAYEKANKEQYEDILDLKSKDNQKLNDELAARFEDYVGLQLDYYANVDKYKHVKELTYNKGQNKTSDWILYDDDCIMFVDCKLKKLTIAGIMETELDREELNRILSEGDFKTKGSIEKLKREQNSPLIKDIIGLGVDLGKILCCYCDWKEGKINGLPQYRDDIHVTATLLMLEESFCGKLEIKECIDAIAYNYVMEKRDVELKGINTRIISSITFDKNMPYIAENGLSQYVYEDNCEIPDNVSIRNDFLHVKFRKTFIEGTSDELE